MNKQFFTKVKCLLLAVMFLMLTLSPMEAQAASPALLTKNIFINKGTMGTIVILNNTKTVKWKVDKPSIAEIHLNSTTNNVCTVMGKKAGTATATATIGKKTKLKCTITVSADKYDGHNKTLQKKIKVSTNLNGQLMTVKITNNLKHDINYVTSIAAYDKYSNKVSERPVDVFLKAGKSTTLYFMVSPTSTSAKPLAKMTYVRPSTNHKDGTIAASLTNFSTTIEKSTSYYDNSTIYNVVAHNKSQFNTALQYQLVARKNGSVFAVTDIYNVDCAVDDAQLNIKHVFKKRTDGEEIKDFTGCDVDINIISVAHKSSQFSQ